MTPDQYRRATLFMTELEILEKMISNIQKSKPTIVVQWGGSELSINSFQSTDNCKTLIEAVESELTSQANSIRKHLENIK